MCILWKIPEKIKNLLFFRLKNFIKNIFSYFGWNIKTLKIVHYVGNSIGYKSYIFYAELLIKSRLIIKKKMFWSSISSQWKAKQRLIASSITFVLWSMNKLQQDYFVCFKYCYITICAVGFWTTILPVSKEYLSLLFRHNCHN